MNEQIVDRKFKLVAVTLILLVLLVYLKSISDIVFQWCLISIVGTYITGNVVQKGIEAFVPPKQSFPDTVIQPPN